MVSSESRFSCQGLPLIDEKKIMEGMALILEAIGEDPCREGLVGTPRRVAEMYGSKTAKTVTRDINMLESINLVQRRGRRVFALGEQLLSMRPLRRSQ